MLGDVEFGKFSLALAVGIIIESILDPGFYQITVREIARKKDLAKQYLSNIIGYKILVSLIAILVLTVGLYFIHTPKTTAFAIIIMVSAGILKSVKNTYSSVFQAYEYFHLDAVIWTLERFILLLVGTIALFMGSGVIGFCLVFAILRLLDIAFVSFLVRVKICNLSIGFNRSFLKTLLKISLPVGIFIIVLNLYNYIDTIMISIIRGDAEVGWYNAAFKLYEGLAVFPMVICVVFRPRIAKLYHQNRAHFEKLFLIGIKYILIISLFLSVTGFLASKLAINILFGEQYDPSITALKILLIGIVFVFVLVYFQMMLIAMDRQKVVLFVGIAGLVVNIVLNLVLIPKFGFTGAASATVIGEFLVFSALLWYLYREELEIPFVKTFAKPVAMMVFPLIIVKVAPIFTNLFIELILINLFFLTSLWIFKMFDPQEFKFMTTTGNSSLTDDA